MKEVLVVSIKLLTNQPDVWAAFVDYLEERLDKERTWTEQAPREITPDQRLYHLGRVSMIKDMKKLREKTMKEKTVV